MTNLATSGVDLESVRDRVQTLGYFLTVLDVQKATQALEQEIAFNPPAAFVSTVSETAEKNTVIGGWKQRVEVVVSVLFALAAERMAGDESDEAEQVRKAVRGILTAWTPGGADTAFQYDRYLIRGTGGGLVWGECLFRTSYQLRG